APGDGGIGGGIEAQAFLKLRAVEVQTVAGESLNARAWAGPAQKRDGTTGAHQPAAEITPHGARTDNHHARPIRRARRQFLLPLAIPLFQVPSRGSNSDGAQQPLDVLLGI